MTDKQLNNYLKALGDYDPQANPNWEAFIAENDARIQKPEKTSIRSGNNSGNLVTGLKYTGTIVIIIAGIFATWYFTGDQESSSDGTNTGLQFINEIQQPANTTNSNTIIVEPAELKTQTEQIQQISPDNAYTAPADNPDILSLPPVSPGGAKIQADPIIHEIISEPYKQPDVIISDTIIIKKTIYIKDTIRGKKLQRN